MSGSYAWVSMRTGPANTIWRPEGTELPITGGLICTDFDAPAGLQVSFGESNLWQSLYPGVPIYCDTDLQNSRGRIRIFPGVTTDNIFAVESSPHVLDRRNFRLMTDDVFGVGSGKTIAEAVGRLKFKVYNNALLPVGAKNSSGNVWTFSPNEGAFTLLLSEFFPISVLNAAVSLRVRYSFILQPLDATGADDLPHFEIIGTRGASFGSWGFWDDRAVDSTPPYAYYGAGGCIHPDFEGSARAQGELVIPGPFAAWDYLSFLSSWSFFGAVLEDSKLRLRVGLSDVAGRSWGTAEVNPSSSPFAAAGAQVHGLFSCGSDPALEGYQSSDVTAGNVILESRRQYGETLQRSVVTAVHGEWTPVTPTSVMTARVGAISTEHAGITFAWGKR